jgi:hypothetical protein
MLKFTHSYCACDIAWFLPVVHSGTAQQNGSNIPGNSTKEEADYEPSVNPMIIKLYECVEKQKKKKKKKDDVDDSQEPAKTDAATREAVMSTHTACLGGR